MKNLKKVSRENLKTIIGGDSTPINDGLGGWRCSSSFEIVCYKGCTPMCMSFNKCMISFCHDPI